jgi:FAD synthetase
MNLKKILIFGVFDVIHDGHLSFIKEAKKQGDQLVVVVARDSMVQRIKNKTPQLNEVERIHNLLDIPEVDLVLLGDPQIGTYNVLKEVNPDIIFLGYDQKDLMIDIKKKIKNKELKEMEILQGSPYKGEEFHSSILNK